jgi:hypothetical protein
MAKQIYRTAQGKPIDLDALRVRNEQSVAVGNMKTNARGDELGPGGIVVRTREQVMKEYYNTNAVYTKERVEQQREDAQNARANVPPVNTGIPDEILEQDQTMDEIEQPKMRGALADAVAKSTKVEQKLLQPKKNNGNGPSRI